MKFAAHRAFSNVWNVVSGYAPGAVASVGTGPLATNAIEREAMRRTWKQLNDALRDCDLATAEELYKAEWDGPARRTHLERTMCRITRLQRLAERKKRGML